MIIISCLIVWDSHNTSFNYKRGRGQNPPIALWINGKDIGDQSCCLSQQLQRRNKKSNFDSKM